MGGGGGGLSLVKALPVTSHIKGYAIYNPFQNTIHISSTLHGYRPCTTSTICIFIFL